MFSLGIFLVSQVLAFLAGLIYYPGRLKSRVDDLKYSTVRIGILIRQDREFAAKAWDVFGKWDEDESLLYPVFFQSSKELTKACQLGLLDAAYVDYYSYGQFKDEFNPLLFESEVKHLRPLMDRSVLVVRTKDLSLGLQGLDERSLGYLNTLQYSSELMVRKYLDKKVGSVELAFKSLNEFNNPLSLVRALDSEKVDMVSLSQDDFYKSLERLGKNRSKYRFLWMSKQYPSYLFAVRDGLDEKIVENLVDFLQVDLLGEGVSEMRLMPVEETFFDPKSVDLEKLNLLRDPA